MRRGALVLALAFAAGQASADPLTDLLDRLFRPAPAAPPVLCKKYTESPGSGNQARAARNRGPSWLASYYGGGERLNARTANGDRFNPQGFTAAHRTLPMGTRLHVCLRGCAVVRINDRGPAAWTGRNLDLSRGAASAIGLVAPGVAPVSVTVLR